MARRIFISYQRQDQPFAERLRARLDELGHATWMDVHDIPTGARWPDEIDRGLNQADAVVGVISPAAVDSRNVRNEWDWAIRYRKPLLLLLKEEPRRFPHQYVAINYIDAQADEAKAFAELQKALRPDRPGGPVVDDPYRDYLEKLYDRINDYLAKKITLLPGADEEAPEPIHLRSERTPGAVDILFSRRAEVDPLYAAGGLDEPGATFETFDVALEQFGGQILLLGAPGAGKTITLLHHGRDAVVRRLQDRAQPLPVLALLSTWEPHEQPSLAEWLATTHGAPLDLGSLLDQGRALLLLDGLDEMGAQRQDPKTKRTYDPRRRFVEAMAELVKIGPNRMLVTCRAQDYEEIGARLPLQGAVTLEPLDDRQIDRYLQRHEALRAAVDADEALRDALRSPLMLSFFVEAYEQVGEADLRRLRDLEQSPGDLRDAVFDTVLQKRYEHEARRQDAALELDLGEIYEHLGLILMLEDRDYLWTSDFRGAFTDEPQARAVAELCVRLNILVSDSGWEDNSYYSFSHLLLHDFVAFRYGLKHLRDADLYWPDESDLSRRERRRRERQGVYRECSPALLLGRAGDARAVTELIAAMSHPEWVVRAHCAVALGDVGDERAAEALTAALEDDSGSVYLNALEALSRLGEPAVGPMIEALSRPEIAADAASVLGELGEPRAVEPLIAALEDPDPSVRSAAAGALEKLGEPQAVEPLITALGDTEDSVRQNVIEALGNLADSRAAEPLAALLHHPDAETGLAAAGAMASLGDSRALEPLVVTLREEEDFVTRRNAIFSLGTLGDARAIEPLVALLGDPNSGIRQTAIFSLAELEAVDPLIELLQDRRAEMRADAASSLGELQESRAVEPLIDLLSDRKHLTWDSSNRVCEIAARALKEIGTPEALAAVDGWQVPESIWRRLMPPGRPFKIGWELYLLALRLVAAGLLLRSGVLKLQGPGAAQAAFEHSSPLAFLPDDGAVYLGVGMELVLSVLLALGLATRFSAWAVVVLTLGGILVDPSPVWPLFGVGGQWSLALLILLLKDAFPGLFSADRLLATSRWARYTPPVRVSTTAAASTLLLLRLAVALPFLWHGVSVLLALDSAGVSPEAGAGSGVSIYAIGLELTLALLLAIGVGGAWIVYCLGLAILLHLIPYPPLTELSAFQSRQMLALVVLALLDTGPFSVQWSSIKTYLEGIEKA